MGLEVQIRKKLSGFCLDVSFQMEQGVFAILGESGSGKSMTLKCIAGIEMPDEGRIVLNGRTLFDAERKICLSPQMRRVGYLFQDYALFPNMTVEKNVLSGMGRHPDRFAARAYLERFRLLGLEDRYPSELSGGQKQRVALARMIASGPELLLLDEPFAALDGRLKETLVQEMDQVLRESGKPALFVSHDSKEVLRLCDTVSRLVEGKMKLYGPIETAAPTIEAEMEPFEETASGRKAGAEPSELYSDTREAQIRRGEKTPVKEMTHFDGEGNAVMVDVREKSDTHRTAAATGMICVGEKVLEAIESRTAKKGDVLAAAQIAGIMAAKRTSELIPLCHSLSMTNCEVRFSILREQAAVSVLCRASCIGKTGVEMEALTGASVALLTIYDMCKAMNRSMKITDVCLLEKDGGKSGHYRREEEQNV